MPAYDYRCPACDVRFEVTRPLGATGDVHCTTCGAVARRLFTPVGVVFKGSGFHNTDYRSTSAAASTAAAPGDAATGAGCDAAGSGASCAGCPAAE